LFANLSMLVRALSADAYGYLILGKAAAHFHLAPWRMKV